MKVRVIIPISSEEFRDSQVEERKNAASPDVEIDVVCLKEGSVSIESSLDEQLVAPGILREVRRAEEEGVDAISIDCAADPALRAIREYADIPVSSGGESAFLHALALGDDFSVVTILEPTARIIRENIYSQGLQSRLRSVRVANVPVLELDQLKNARKTILKQSRIAIDDDGADIIVLGCTGMSPVAKFVQSKLEVPVIDPAVSALRMAEDFVRMGIQQSRLAYPTPPEKEVKGEYWEDFSYT